MVDIRTNNLGAHLRQMGIELSSIAVLAGCDEVFERIKATLGSGNNVIGLQYHTIAERCSTAIPACEVVTFQCGKAEASPTIVAYEPCLGAVVILGKALRKVDKRIRGVLRRLGLQPAHKLTIDADQCLVLSIGEGRLAGGSEGRQDFGRRFALLARAAVTYRDLVSLLKWHSTSIAGSCDRDRHTAKRYGEKTRET